MAKRKQTPDVLAEILGGGSTLLESEKEVSAPALRSAGKKTPFPQQAVRLEYVVVTFQDYRGWRPRYYNGRELKDWMNGPLIHDYLAGMGEEGWELAAASSGERLYGNADNHHLYFRRSQ